MSGKKSPLSMVSPLTTREQRDRLVRRPIDRAEEEQDEADGDPGEVPRAPTARFLRSSLRSPTDKAAGQRGGRQFATSSPLDDVRGGIGGGHDDNTPGVSMITDEDARPRQAARGKPTTPRSSTGSAGSGKKRTSLRSKLDESSLLSLDTTEDEPEEEDDDDLQPAARITRRRPNKVPSPRKPLGFNASQSLAKEKEPEGAGWAYLFFLGIFLSLVVASGCLYLGFLRPEFFVSSPGLNRLFVDMGSEEAQVDYNRTVEKLRRQIVGLKEQFPSQEKKIWTTVLASLKGVLKPEPKQPSVILLIGDGKAFKSTQCLASKLSSLATVLLAESNDAAPQHVGSSFPSKSALHRQLESDLSLRSAFSLSHLELLPGSSAMALHAFCDNISAPYKRASIVLAVEEEEGESLLPDVAAERVLTRSWSTELDEDRVSPLLSRLTVSVVRIAPEKNSPCS